MLHNLQLLSIARMEIMLILTTNNKVLVHFVTNQQPFWTEQVDGFNVWAAPDGSKLRKTNKREILTYPLNK